MILAIFTLITAAFCAINFDLKKNHGFCQIIGPNIICYQVEYVSPTRRTTGQMVPEQLGLNPAKIQVMKVH